ncbi:MAG: PspC domain-containing protein [Candidatus Krumholzibacteriia bacterium]
MPVDGERRLTRTADRRIGGVCGGLAAYFGASPTVVRVGWAAVTVLSFILPGLLVYLILWAALPAAPRA